MAPLPNAHLASEVHAQGRVEVPAKLLQGEGPTLSHFDVGFSLRMQIAGRVHDH
jgi:hypothetical protein